MIYLLDIFFISLYLLWYLQWQVKAVSRNILFKHRIRNSEFELMYFTPFNLSSNRLLHLQRHLHSCTLIIKQIPHSNKSTSEDFRVDLSLSPILQNGSLKFSFSRIFIAFIFFSKYSGSFM